MVLLIIAAVYLLLYPKHVAGRFVVGKRGTVRLRPIWNGSSLSVASADPPAPRRLANPASLPHIRVKPGERLYFSKRDAASFFDALEAPATLRAWFGCPDVKAGPLARKLGVGLGDLSDFVDDLHGNLISGDTILFPCITSWPMGFAWSLYFAQRANEHVLEQGSTLHREKTY